MSELKTDVAGTFHWRCIHKWHGIEKGRALNVEKVDFVVALIMGWIEQQLIERSQITPGSLT